MSKTKGDLDEARMTNQRRFLSKKVLTLWFAILVTTLAVSAAPGSFASRFEPDHEKQVRDFVTAFNERNLDSMLSKASENIQWLNVDGAKITVETEGKAALRKSMETYFRQCPSCRSSLEWVQSAGNRVTALERASWTGTSGPMAQKSLSVYEFNQEGIVRVFYFPAERE
jgi:hypothetical protein